jgi:ATP-dependent exoDNAse (exonuclease V) beta subunit
MIIPESTNAVKIMTIHASKGLEFPVVIIPYCNWQIYRAGDSWVQVNNEKVQLPVSVIHLTKKVGASGFEKELLAEQQNQVLDNLNLLYVAFTRAVERLHIISNVAATNKQETVSNWIEAFINKQGQAQAPGLFEIGACTEKKSAHVQKSLPHYPLLPLQFNTNRNAIQIKASYLQNSHEAEEAKEEGIRIHHLLSGIKTQEDIDSALASALLEGLISKQELPILRSKLKNITEHPELSPYFQIGINCRLEAELITANGEILRPDRIVFKEQETILMDYKTGKENTTSYFKQLYKYESALLSMGYPVVKKLLVYLDNMKVVHAN